MRMPFDGKRSDTGAYMEGEKKDIGTITDAERRRRRHLRLHQNERRLMYEGKRVVDGLKRSILTVRILASGGGRVVDGEKPLQGERKLVFTEKEVVDGKNCLLQGERNLIFVEQRVADDERMIMIGEQMIVEQGQGARIEVEGRGGWHHITSQIGIPDPMLHSLLGLLPRSEEEGDFHLANM